MWNLRKAVWSGGLVTRKAEHAWQRDVPARRQRHTPASPGAHTEHATPPNQQTSFVEFMRRSPWVGVELDLRRDQSRERDIEL